MPLYTNKTLPVIEDSVATVAAADRPDKKHTDGPGRQGELAKSLPKAGVEATLKTGQAWRTQIQFDPVHAPSEDGAGVECTMLGPDHPSGSGPDSSNIRVCPNRHHLDGFGTYKKGHLLNEWLGGPGTDTRNLTAIPTKTNGAMSQDMEETLKALVNDQRAWIYYKAKVTHTRSSNKKNWYASKISCEWWELKPDGAGLPEAVPNTKATAVFDIPDPVEYESDGKDATAFKTTLTDKTAGPPRTKDAATAEAAVEWNSIVLRNWDYAKKLKEAFDVAEPLVEELKRSSEASAAEKVGTELVDTIARAPLPAEAGALKWLATELEALMGDPSRPIDANLKSKLGEYDAERKKRIDGVLIAVRSLLQKHVPTNSATYIKKVESVLVTNDPLSVYQGLIAQCLERHDSLVNEKLELEKENDEVTSERDGLKQENEELRISEAENRADTMSPQSVYDVDEQLDPGQHAGDPSGSRKRVRAAARDTSGGFKNQKLIQGKKPTRSAELLSIALHEIKQALADTSLAALPAAFDQLKDVDPGFHAPVNAYLTDSGGLIEDTLVTYIVHGYAGQSKNEHQFMAYLAGMKAIPEFDTAFTNAAGKL